MPLLAAACWFAIGITLAHSWIPTAWLALCILALASLATTTLFCLRRIALLPLAGLWIAVGAWSWQLRPVPLNQHDLQHYADGLSREVRGHVMRVHELPPRSSLGNHDADPTWWEEREPERATALLVDIAVDAVEEVTPDISRMVPATGGVRVTLLTSAAPLTAMRCGDIVQIPLMLRVPQRFKDPGAWQYADYLLTQGIGVHATTSASKAKIISTDDASLHCRLAAAQSWASARMLAFVSSPQNRWLPSTLRLSQDDAGMLDAMLFGDRTRLSQQRRLGFERTGSFHLFVVSGMHVALLAAMILWALHRLRVRDWLAALIALPLLTGYALLTGFGAPVQRALFMTAVFLVARLLTRERSVLNAAGAAALIELVWSPSSLFEASFQMTFLAVFAIAGIAGPLGERTFMPWARASRRLHELWQDPVLPPRLAQLRVMLRLWGELLAGSFGRWFYQLPGLLISCILWLAELAMIGLVAEMIMALPMALYFHRATLFALPANMLTIPIIGVLAPLAIASFLASLIAPWLAVIPSAMTAALLHGMGAIITRISSSQIADLRVAGPAWWVALAALFVWAFCLWAVRQSKGWALIATVMLPLGTLLVLWPEPARLTAGQLEVTAIDVGQGDSLLVVGPGKRTMLIDAGGPVGRTGEAATAGGTFDIGEEVVSPYLWSRSIARLDVLVLSHAHSDHMGGMPAVMRNLRPRELWVSIDPASDAYRSLTAEATKLGITIRHMRGGDALPWDDTQITVLAPDIHYTNDADPTNNDSLVLRIDYGHSSVLLEGDAEAASEQAMLEHGLAPVTLLKVGHHGSKTSTTEQFFNALHPRAAVVSVGRGNTFGHPRGEVIQRIASGHTRLYRTDEFGLTTFLLSRDGSIQEHVGEDWP
jgi:competence protein ComEC